APPLQLHRGLDRLTYRATRHTASTDRVSGAACAASQSALARAYATLLRSQANRSALHVALPAQIIELGSTVHRTAIVPHAEVAYPPAMGVNELPLRRVCDELIN